MEKENDQITTAEKKEESIEELLEHYKDQAEDKYTHAYSEFFHRDVTEDGCCC